MFSKQVESLRLQLLRWLLAPLLLLLSVNAWFSDRAAVATADLAFDRLLTASAEAIAEAVALQGGEVVVDLPYAALELLESNLQERIFYRVVAPGGRTVTGYDDLPLPPPPQRGGKAADSTLYAARYRGETVHLIALAKTLYGSGLADPVLIVVAETGEARDAFSHRILVEGLERQALLIGAAGLLVGLGLVRGLRPLRRLSSAVTAREPSDLSPIDARVVQTEVRPLIEAINGHMARIGRLLASRERLIADASHQMRTPLSEMRTQIEYSLRQDRPELARQTLVDVHADVERLARLVSQLLLQARSDPDALAEPPSAVVDLVELARQATLDQVGAARKRRIDLAFEEPPQPALVAGHALLLRELVANLVDNAIAYGREGGHVTVRVLRDEQVALEVVDDGPGIAPQNRERVFQRFYRSPEAAAAVPRGSGLGLAIVRDIAQAHRARVELLAPAAGPGLRVRVTLAACAAPGPAA